MKFPNVLHNKYNIHIKDFYNKCLDTFTTRCTYFVNVIQFHVRRHTIYVYSSSFGIYDLNCFTTYFQFYVICTDYLFPDSRQQFYDQSSSTIADN